jgi:hypothetical protein
MPPLSRMPPLTPKRLDAGQSLRQAGPQKPACGIEHDVRRDGAADARRNVLEHDGIRLCALIPRRAHDLRPETRVCAQAAVSPYCLYVRAYVGLRWEVGRPARIQRAGEGVRMARYVRSTALNLRDRHFAFPRQ